MQEIERPFAGEMSAVPPVRARTPSPVRKVMTMPQLPAPARDFDLQPSTVEVIYAEDEEVFRETAILELLKAGFVRSNIHEADNGLGALEHLARLQFEGNAARPLLVLLDVRMPGMDGRECAFQIQELIKKQALRREPFVVCISSIHRQVIVDEGKGNFQVVLPKPINKAFVDEVVNLLSQWWTLGLGRQLSAWKTFDPGQIDIICADCEPVCRLAASTAFIQAGVSAAAVEEADDEEDLMEALQTAQDGDATRPFIVLLGTLAWATLIRDFFSKQESRGQRQPFVVCTSVDSDRMKVPAMEHFHAFLPGRFNQADVRWCLEFCRLWWQTRGDGPGGAEEDSDAESMGSIGSAGSFA